MYDDLVVDAGLAGGTVAEHLANELRATVFVVDKCPHIAGNCYDSLSADGLRCTAHHRLSEPFHPLAPVRTSRCVQHLRPAVPIPIDRTTVNALYGLDLDEAGVAAFLAAGVMPLARTVNSEDFYRVARRARPVRAILAWLNPAGGRRFVLSDPLPVNRTLCDHYRRLAASENNVTFVGQPAEYRYYNMDQAVASALAAFKVIAHGAGVAS